MPEQGISTKHMQYAFKDRVQAERWATVLRESGYNAEATDPGWGTGETIIMLRLNEPLLAQLAGLVNLVGPETFFEEDESVDDIVDAFERGEKGITMPPAFHDRIEGIKRRLAASTQGDWRTDEGFGGVWVVTGGRVDMASHPSAREMPGVVLGGSYADAYKDADFSAHAHQDVPWLVERLFAARQAAATWEEHFHSAQGDLQRTGDAHEAEMAHRDQIEGALERAIDEKDAELATLRLVLKQAESLKTAWNAVSPENHVSSLFSAVNHHRETHPIPPPMDEEELPF